MENFPTRHKEKQDSIHLDVLNQIEEILTQRTAPTQYKHVYSHTLDDPKDEKDLIKQTKKREKMYLKYGEERANRYSKNNQKVDKLADKGRESEEIHTPRLNKFMNNYVIATTRKYKSAKMSKQIINTRIRKEIKEQIRIDTKDALLKKEKYEIYNQYKSKISQNSQFIMKTKMHTYEDSKKMMIRMIHQTLPTCDKMYRLVTTEQYTNESNQKDNYFYTDKYE